MPAAVPMITPVDEIPGAFTEDGVAIRLEGGAAANEPAPFVGEEALISDEQRAHLSGWLAKVIFDNDTMERIVKRVGKDIPKIEPPIKLNEVRMLLVQTFMDEIIALEMDGLARAGKIPVEQIPMQWHSYTNRQRNLGMFDRLMRLHPRFAEFAHGNYATKDNVDHVSATLKTIVVEEAKLHIPRVPQEQEEDCLQVLQHALGGDETVAKLTWAALMGILQPRRQNPDVAKAADSTGELDA